MSLGPTLESTKLALAHAHARTQNKKKPTEAPSLPVVVASYLKKEMADIDEKSVASAMRARVAYFQEQADSLTLEGVRRVLEKDLGLDQFALDAHKRLIKHCLHQSFDAASNENVSKSSGGTGEEVSNSANEQTPDLSEKTELLVKEETQESPVLGLLAGDDMAPNGIVKAEGVTTVKAISEDIIKKAVRKRTAYFQNNSETLSLAGARRLLEEDLKLDRNGLDPYRELIKEQLDEVLQSGVAEPANGVKNKKRKKVISVGSSDSMDDIEEEEVKPKKKVAAKQKLENTKELKSRNRPAKETMKSSYKQKKPVESMSEESGKAKDDGDVSEDGRSTSSVEEPVKKRNEVSSQVYGKHVERLRSVIKSCGISIPPQVYKRAKQAPETKREACLIKELEEMLKKEGLSTEPSEKEIKEVRKQKERKKELEGIDLSNIVSSSRRRSTQTFVAPPKSQISAASDDDKEDDSEDNDSDDDDDDNDDSDDGNEVEGADDSDSEELNEDVEDESD